MGFEELLSGQELIARHTNNIKELPIKGLKGYCPDNSWLEKRLIENQLDEKLDFISTHRIEKSINLSQAEWIPELKKAKVTKKIGKFWATAGHHQDNEDWLLPEEVLFLMETCELQLYCGNVPISIEDCYTLLFHEGDCSLDEYRVFSYLSRVGLRVLRHSSSVSATRYEKQVKLDSVIERQKRAPPKTNDDDCITITDDDVCIIEETGMLVPNGTNNISNVPSNQEVLPVDKNVPCDIEVIEIEDDPEVNNDADIDSDNDVICISSPSYSGNTSRDWYPTVKNCLRVLDKVINLCEYTSKRRASVDNSDLLRSSKAHILSAVPSVQDGESIIQVPDSRLLPPNIVPRYSEYKVNLNILADNSRPNRSISAQQNGRNGRLFYGSEPSVTNNALRNNPIINNPLMSNALVSNPSISNALISNPSMSNALMNSPLINNVRIGNANFDISSNPLMQKAYEMQEMAMTMMQTASTFMSVISTPNHNPNELWNMLGNTNPQFSNQMHFNPNFGVSTNQRPFFQQRRYNNFRYPRRRSYFRRNSSWDVRKPYFNSNVPKSSYHGMKRPYDNRVIVPDKAAVLSDEVVILSDDDEMEIVGSPVENEATSGKRKTVDMEVTSKRLKTEDEVESKSTLSVNSTPSSLTKEETSIAVKNDPDELAFEDVATSIKKECDSKVKVKDECSLVEIKNECTHDITEDLNETNEKSSIGKIEEITNGIIVNIDKGHSDSDNNGKSDNQKNVECCVKEEPPADKSKILEGANDIIKEAKESIEDCELSKEHISSLNENASNLNVQINSWEQYKSVINDFEDEDCLLRFNQCESYDQILSAMQIFKKIEVSRVPTKLKVSFDVYLPDSNFKKSLKILPNYRVIILKHSDDIPTALEIGGLNVEYQDNIPFLFTIVCDETITLYMYNNISLNTCSM